MEHPTDWLLLWRQIVEEHDRARRPEGESGDDKWKNRGASFQEMVRKRWEHPDSSRDFILGCLDRDPGSTVLDIGAGTGAWACLMAPHAARVVAVEPSASMASYFELNVRKLGLTNVEIIREPWPDALPGPCDYSLCSHAMYGFADFRKFIERMVEVTRKTCFLLMRVPTSDGVMAEAAMRVWGHPHDSANFQIAYNALLQMGIQANVLMEDTGMWKPWKSASIDEALGDVKRRLGLVGETVHDEYLRALLERRLVLENNEYVWPKGVRSALVYWDVSLGTAS